eukprot:13017444-Alexandrium_andersonii.AAC.1
MRARSWRTQRCAKGACATTRLARPSPASGGSGIIIGPCSRPIMSLRCWTCGGRWPSALGRR